MKRKKQSPQSHVRSDRARANKDIQSNPKFAELKISRKSLAPLKRAEMEFEICQGKHLRAFAAALGVDPGTIRRDLKLLTLSKTDKNKIARGGSVNSVLKQTRVQQADVARYVRIGLLEAEIVDWVDRVLGPAGNVNLMDEVLRLLPQLRRAGELARIKPSRMSSAEIRHYTRPKKRNPNDPLGGFYVQLSWLIQWMFRREEDYEVVFAATKLARHYYRLQPPTLPHEFDYLQPIRKYSKEQKTSPEPPEAIRAEQSPNARAAAARQNTESAQIERAEDPHLARLRELMNSKEPVAGITTEVKIVNVGEEREAQQRGADERRQASTRSIRHEMGWEKITRGAEPSELLAPEGRAGKSDSMVAQGGKA